MTARLDPQLESTNRLLEIWGRDERAGSGGLHPLYAAELLSKGEQLGGAPLAPDDVMVIVERTVLSSPGPTRALLKVWYRSNDAAEVKARRLGLSRATLYVHWNHALHYVRGRLHEAGLMV